MNKSYTLKSPFTWKHRKDFLEAIEKRASKVLTELADKPTKCYRSLVIRPEYRNNFDSRFSSLFDEDLSGDDITDEEIIENHSSLLLNDVEPAFRAIPIDENTTTYIREGVKPCRPPAEQMTEMIHCLREWGRNNNLNDNWIMAVAIRTIQGGCHSFIYYPAEYFVRGIVPKEILCPKLTLPAWDFLHEKDNEYIDATIDVVKDLLRAYCSDVVAYLDNPNNQENKVVANSPKREKQHFEWLVRWQIDRRTMPEIAEEFRVNISDNREDTVKKALGATASLIGLTLRKGR